MEPLATLLAAVAGAMVAVLIMDGPLWLLAPGALGALLPLTVAKARNRGHGHD